MGALAGVMSRRSARAAAMPPPKRQRTNKELTAEIADLYMKDRDKFVAGDKD